MNPELNMLNGLSSIQHPTLEQIIRAGAKQMIAMAIEAEVKAYVEQFQHITTPEGKAAMVRNGYLPERSIASSAGPTSFRLFKSCSASFPLAFHRRP